MRKKNPKKFWQYANSKRKTKSGISELIYKKENGEDNKTSTDKEKAVYSPMNQMGKYQILNQSQ